MAIVKFTAIVAGLRGTLGGTVFSANKSGAYIKHWRMPTNQMTERISTFRGRLSTFSAQWRSLSSAQQAAWDAWAAAPAQVRHNSLSDPYYMSGFQAFCSTNMNLRAFLRAATSTPPASTKPAPPTLSTLTAYKTTGSGSTTLTWPASEFSTMDGLFTAALVNSTGRLNNAAAFPIIGGQYPTAATSINIQSMLENRFGILQVGQRLMLRVYRQTTDGYRSAASAIQANVVA